MSESAISTISEFLLHAGTDYRVFDMGRTIRSVSTQAFLDMENGQLQPQFPRLEHAWFGIIFWDKTRSTQHYIWFVKLPVDEQGMLVAAARNHFLQIIVDALGAGLENAESKNAQLPENPYSFIPNQNQLADFNSISRKKVALGQSQFYDLALRYIQTPLVIDWQTVPQQGLADVAANLKDKTIYHTLVDNIENYPTPAQFALLTSFENHPIDVKLVEKIVGILAKNPDDIALWQHGIRSLAQSPCKGLVRQVIKDCLSNDKLSSEHGILVVLSGRLFSHFEQQDLLKVFLDAVAKADESFALFHAVFRDLVQIPSLRVHLLASLRWTDKSDALTAAVGSLFSATENSDKAK